jgi:branched-subunit amino acid ABC-type transport system permease component
MDLALVLLLEILNGIASLVLISVGLAIIFGMMRVINLAHGEFLMLGGYAAIVATNRGVNIWIAMLVIAPLVVGIIGVIAERLIIHVLYGRMIDTLLATWGLSLFFVGIVTTMFGNTVAGIGAPLGSVAVGRYNISLYRLVLVAIATTILAVLYVVLRATRLGLLARATMENPNMAAALGVSPPRVYATTFGVGAAVTGLAGGLLAPISGVLPTVGTAYVAKAFITVISGGTATIAGTATAAGLFGSVNQLLTYFTTPVIGEAGLLAAAILLLRVLPHGITGRLFRGSL